jgi:ABC-type nitrate/sulfonate/bicarbonate transport system substrate-binding protein
MRLLLTLCFSAVFCLVIPLSTARGAEAEKLNVVYSSIAAVSLSSWIPKEAGIYKKYGLDVNLIYVAGSQAIATLISGDAQIAQGSGAAAMLSRLSGAEVKLIGNIINVIPMSLVTTPDRRT